MPLAKTIFPLTITADRYLGCYSGGEYLAWNLHPYQVPADIAASDGSAISFWAKNRIPVGKGDTIGAAIEDLLNKLAKD